MTPLSACLRLAGTEFTEYLLYICWLALCQLGTRDSQNRRLSLVTVSHRSNRNPNWDRACVTTTDLWVLSCNWLCPIVSKWSIFWSWMMKMYLCCALRWAGHNPDLNMVWDQVLTVLPTAWLFPPNLISPSLRRIKGGREEADLVERLYPVFLRWCLLESYSKFRDGAGRGRWFSR